MKRTLGLDATLALLIALALSCLYIKTARPGQDWGGDFAQYINHARNLAEGRPYADTRYIQTFPDAVIHMPAVYPPVFPLLLAPVYARYGLNYGPMQILTGGLFVMAALTIFVVARMRALSPWLAAAAATAFGSSGIVLTLTDKILSDGAYLVFAGLALAMMIVAERNGWDIRRPMPAAALIVVPMLLAYGSRAVGLSLALAFGLYQAVVKRRVSWFNVLVVTGFCAGVLLYSRTVFDSRAYGNQFETTVAILVQNALYYLKVPASLWAGSPTPVRYALLALTAPIAAAEWMRRLLRRPSVLEFYAVAALIPVLIYSSAGTARYMLPVLAFYFVYFLEGVEFWRSRWKLGWWIPAAACVLLAIGAVFNLRGAEKGPYAQGVEQPSFIALCDYVTHSVSPDALIVSWNPRVLALYTDRRSAWYPQGASGPELAAYLQQGGAEYALVYRGNPEDAGRLGPLLEGASDFAAVFHNSDFMLYRRKSLP